MVHAIEQGYPQREIEQSAYHFNRSIDDGLRQIVGINCFQAKQAETPILLFKMNEAATQRQCDAVNDLRNRRDAAEVERTLAEIGVTARSTGNLMPPILSAVRAYATIGEICRTLADAFGEYSESYH